MAPAGAEGPRLKVQGEDRWEPPAPGTPEWRAAVETWNASLHRPEPPPLEGRPAPPSNGTTVREPGGIPLRLRATGLRVPLSQLLFNLSQLHAGWQEILGRSDVSDHPHAAKLMSAMAEAERHFSLLYHDVGVALACVAPGTEADS